jgi:hypothetical protein
MGSEIQDLTFQNLNKVRFNTGTLNNSDEKHCRVSVAQQIFTQQNSWGEENTVFSTEMYFIEHLADKH